MALRCAAGDETGKIFDGVLAMDPNLDKSTCVLTTMLSNTDPRSPKDIVPLLQHIAGDCETIDDWVQVHGHMINCVSKLNSDLSTLVRQCQDIAGPFLSVQPDDITPFIQWFRLASERTSKVHCKFVDDSQKRAIIADARMQHLENKCLGDRFTDDAFAFIPESSHLDLMRPEVFMRHMGDLLASISN
ncbi:MAG: hypothetical protein GY838_01440 [bacterium]|nr:hypothetical protein [bacterium]